jgi:hypothetical protein
VRIHRYDLTQNQSNHFNLYWILFTGRWIVLRQDELGMISYRYDSYRKDVSIKAYEQEADSL